MSEWKTRLEIWSEGQKVTSRWIEILFGFLQEEIVTYPLDFAYLRCRYVSYYNKTKGQENLETEM